MQSYVMNADTIKRDQTLFMPMGNGKIGLIDVRDIAAVAVACLTEPCHEGKKYVLTGPEALSNFDVAEKLSDALGKRVVYADVSPLQSEEAMKKAGMPAWQIRVLLELFQICKDGYAEQLTRGGADPEAQANHVRRISSRESHRFSRVWGGDADRRWRAIARRITNRDRFIAQKGSKYENHRI